MQVLDTQLTTFCATFGNIQKQMLRYRFACMKTLLQKWTAFLPGIVLWEAANLRNTPLVVEPLSYTAMYHISKINWMPAFKSLKY